MPLSLPSAKSEVSWLGWSDKSSSVKSSPQGSTDKPILWPLCCIDPSSISSGRSDKRGAGCGQGSGRAHQRHQMCSREACWWPIHVSAEECCQGKGAGHSSKSLSYSVAVYWFKQCDSAIYYSADAASVRGYRMWICIPEILSLYYCYVESVVSGSTKWFIYCKRDMTVLIRLCILWTFTVSVSMCG